MCDSLITFLLSLLVARKITVHLVVPGVLESVAVMRESVHLHTGRVGVSQPRT